MLTFRSLNLLCISVLILFSCRKSFEPVEGINFEEWKKDRNGCTYYRVSTIDTLRAQKQKMLAMKSTEIAELLGRPDRNELYKRNQKFFSYFLSPGPGCGLDSTQQREGLKLNIRFNAMGLAKEIAIE